MTVTAPPTLASVPSTTLFAPEVSIVATDTSPVPVTLILTAPEASPESAAAVNTYPIATLADSGHADLAEAFVEYVLGPRGQQVLKHAGFGHP